LIDFDRLAKVPRDDQFRALVNTICDLYTRDLGPHERVLSLDEKTSLQPRTRTSRNRPAPPTLERCVESCGLMATNLRQPVLRSGWLGSPSDQHRQAERVL
jgi:hypothetical protein